MKLPLSVYFTCLFLLVICSCENKNELNQKPADATSQFMHLSSDEGIEWNVLGSKITGKILSTDSNSEYSVIITETPPNAGPPRHTHTREDELFYVIKGRYEFTCGDEVIIAEQGDLVHLPKGKPHSFKNIDTIVGSTMNTITPGGFEGFFEEISSLANKSKLGRPQIDSLANVYGISFLKEN